MADSENDAVVRLLKRGLNHYGLGDLEAAIASWEEARQLDPDNHAVRDYLETAYEEAGRPPTGGAGPALAEESIRPVGEEDVRQVRVRGHVPSVDIDGGIVSEYARFCAFGILEIIVPIAPASANGIAYPVCYQFSKTRQFLRVVAVVVSVYFRQRVSQDVHAVGLIMECAVMNERIEI